MTNTISRGTQRIISVNYLFGKPLTPSDFLERIVTSNFRDMKNLISVVFGLLKMSFLVPNKGQLSFSERRQGLKCSGKRQKSPNEGLPGVLGNKGTKGKYRKEQRNMTPVLGNAGT